MSRPEHQGPPDLYYNETEAQKYTCNPRIIEIQTEMAERALELLALPEDDVPKLILDLGCGSGLSGAVLSDAGHHWIGCDISPFMLGVAKDREEAEEDLLLGDMGQGIGFRPSTFDGAISISALQWLCTSNASHENPKRRLHRLFSTLFASLSRGARAVLQFYPENADQIDLILGIATKAGFNGGLVVDYPNSAKAKKYYLCLLTGTTNVVSLPRGLEEGDEEISQVHIADRQRLPKGKSRKRLKDRDWVLRKKELARKRGYENIPLDTKYTARKRGPRF